MTRQEKDQCIDQLAAKLDANKNLYLTDISGLTVDASNKLRRLCFNKGVQLEVVKNTLLKKAMEKVETDYEEAYELLVGNTALMYSEFGNLPAKVIEEFRKKNDKPLLKGAYVESSFYLGDEQVKELAALKSKDELIGEVIALLQSPAKNVISALQSGGNNLSGILKTLGDRPEDAVAAPASTQAPTEAKEEVKEESSEAGETTEATVEATEEASAEEVKEESSDDNTSEDETTAEGDESTETSEEAKEEEASDTDESSDPSAEDEEKKD